MEGSRLSLCFDYRKSYHFNIMTQILDKLREQVVEATLNALLVGEEIIQRSNHLLLREKVNP